MNIRPVVKSFQSWATTSIVAATLIGFAMCLGDTGHVGALGTLLILACAGAFFGFAGGIPFALLFASVAPYVRTRLRRAVAAVVLGALSGLVGIYVTAAVVGISNSITIGSVAGAIIGLLCGSLLVPNDEHRTTVA